MAWEKLEGGVARVTITESGRIRWNDSAHVHMKAPIAILLHYDALANRLGFQEMRSMETDPCALAVVNGPDEEGKGARMHGIEAATHLAKAGIEIESDYETVLQPPTPQPPWPAEELNIHWIELPAPE